MWAGPGYDGPGLYLYVYHMDPPTGWVYGDDLDGTADPTQFNVVKAIETGRWYRVKLFVQLDTGNNLNGILRIWVDGNKVLERTDLRYRNDGGSADTLLFHVFYGGSTDDYKPDQTQYIRLNDVKWY